MSERTVQQRQTEGTETTGIQSGSLVCKDVAQETSEPSSESPGFVFFFIVIAVSALSCLTAAVAVFAAAYGPTDGSR